MNWSLMIFGGLAVAVAGVCLQAASWPQTASSLGDRPNVQPTQPRMVPATLKTYGVWATEPRDRWLPGKAAWDEHAATVNATGNTEPGIRRDSDIMQYRKADDSGPIDLATAEQWNTTGSPTVIAMPSISDVPGGEYSRLAIVRGGKTIIREDATCHWFNGDGEPLNVPVTEPCDKGAL